MQREIIQAKGKKPLVVHCGLIRLTIAIGASYSDVNDSVSAVVPEAIYAFQNTFPDKYEFRTRLISEALRYKTCNPDKVSILCSTCTA